MEKRNESGRTMLEMLGVLAIIGIITYGAIAGINYGMSSYKVNQTYNEVQEIIQGIEDLYSWSNGYPSGEAASGSYAGCSKIFAAACENDVLQECTSTPSCTAKGAFGDIEVEVIESGDNFQVTLSIADEGDRLRVQEMDWININCNCTDGGVCTFSPK